MGGGPFLHENGVLYNTLQAITSVLIVPQPGAVNAWNKLRGSSSLSQWVEAVCEQAFLNPAVSNQSFLEHRHSATSRNPQVQAVDSTLNLIQVYYSSVQFLRSTYSRFFRCIFICYIYCDAVVAASSPLKMVTTCSGVIYTRLRKLICYCSFVCLF